MIIRGFIKEVGQTREWTDKNGEKKQSVKLVMEIPYVSKEGKEHRDELMGEMSFGNPEFLDSLKRTCEAGEKCEFHVGFFLSEWKEKRIQNIKVFNLSKLLA